MPRNSKNKAPIKKATRFRSEVDAADWYASPAGQRHTEHILRDAIRKGSIKVSKGVDVVLTDPAVLQELVERARKTMTQAVSLRIPKGDIEAAKRIAERKGVGYQTVLKEAIREGLRHA
jgi:hypothetical protein